jgi:SAM-dependent methyltransferase
MTGYVSDASSFFDFGMSGLELHPSGIWLASHQAKVSYPEAGHAACRAIEDRSFWFRHRTSCIVRLIRRFSSGDPFLDLGGGSGLIAMSLTEAGIPCALVEPSLDAAINAHARGVRPVICARIEYLAPPPGSVADCGLFDVLEHIEDDLEMLQRLHAWLKPDGRLFLSVPAYQWLFAAEDVTAGHYRRYTAHSLARVLRAAGFDILFTSYLFMPLPMPVFLLRTLAYRLGRKRSAPVVDAAEQVPGWFGAWILDRLLAWEARRLEAGRAIPFGTSCLCVASKR